MLPMLSTSIERAECCGASASGVRRSRSTHQPTRTGKRKPIATPRIALVAVGRQRMIAVPTTSRGMPCARKKHGECAPAALALQDAGLAAGQGQRHGREGDDGGGGEVVEVEQRVDRGDEQAEHQADDERDLGAEREDRALDRGDVVRSTAMRRAAVAWRPSATTCTTISRLRQATNAPYWLGPMMRAASMVNP